MADSLMGVSKTRSPRAGLLIAVNQQLRYDEGMAAARAMVQAGWIGKVTAKTFTVNVTTDWAPWPWLVHSDRLEIMYHSIHYLDAGIDTGDVIAQRLVEFEAAETLRSSYARLQAEIARLFAEHWSRIRTGHCSAAKQAGAGSFHRVADRDKVAHLLTNGWDTSVADLEKAGAAWRLSRRLP